MSAGEVHADALREAILPLLAAAGWMTGDAAGGPRYSADARSGDRTVTLGTGRLIVDILDQDDVPIEDIVSADITSVEQAIGYLRLAGALPTVEVISRTALWRCPDCHTSYIRPYEEHREGCPPLEPVTITVARREVAR
jgi:hypothetical protein